MHIARPTALVLLPLMLVVLGACQNEPPLAPPAQPPKAAAAELSAAETAEPAEPAEVDALPEGAFAADATPVEEMNDADLQAACFAGRQQACDLLGH